MILWLLIGLLSAAVAALFAWPLIRARPRDSGDTRDLAVYRDQLAELDRDVARGLLPESEAAAARLEIQRRLLAAAGRPPTDARGMGRASGRAPAWTLVLLLLPPAAAIVLYLDLGHPGLPGQPFASRAPAAPAGQNLEQVVDALAANMKANPSDPKGWELLASTEATLGHFKESADAYAEAIARWKAKGEPPSADLQSRYGEALTAIANQVTPAAKAAFDAALAIDPKDARARFYLGLAEVEAGHLEAALQQWVALEADSPADATWRPLLTQKIDELARQLGRDPATLPGRKPAPTATGPTQQDLAKAANMTPEERKAFIESMVASLAQKLRDQPNDVEGWLKLGNAYSQLGRAQEALGAWREAAMRGSERLDAQVPYAAAVAATADLVPLPADFAVVVERMRKLAPENGLALYCAGLIARASGDKVQARQLWQRVLPLTPEGSSQRKELEAKIAALGQ